VDSLTGALAEQERCRSADWLALVLLSCFNGYVAIRGTLEGSTQMRKMICGAALAALTLSTAARAADEERNWSLGAGVVFNQVVSIGSASAVNGVTGGFLVSAPTAVANLERRLDRHLWLTLGVDVSATSFDTTVAGVQPNSTTSYVTFAVAPGLRKIVTPDDAPVEVSVLGELDFGFARGSISSGGAPSATTQARLTRLQMLALNRSSFASRTRVLAVPSGEPMAAAISSKLNSSTYRKRQAAAWSAGMRETTA
jgi:hypothetical protein